MAKHLARESRSSRERERDRERERERSTRGAHHGGGLSKPGIYEFEKVAGPSAGDSTFARCYARITTAPIFLAE